jgi:hypothetical protein
MKKTTIVILALILTGVLSGAVYAENTGVDRDDWCFVTAQAETIVASGEPVKTTEAVAAGETKPTQAIEVSVSEDEEWNLHETIHDY